MFNTLKIKKMFKALKSNWFIMLIVLIVGVYFKDAIIGQLSKISPSLASKLQPVTGTPTPPAARLTEN